MALPELQRSKIIYPEFDGTHMAETDLHRVLMVDLIDAVAWHFRMELTCYVSGNLFIYYEEGKPRKKVAPDFFFVWGVPKKRRRIYKVWEEKKEPDLTIELTSSSTKLEDLGNKRAIYETLGVREYFIFDPEKASPPVLRGFVLEKEAFHEQEPLRLEDGAAVFYSKVLNLEL